MATVRYDAVAKAGTYMKDGEEKTRWHVMGRCIQNDQGQLSVKIDSTPIGWDGWISLMEPKPKDKNQGAGTAPRNQGAGSSPMDDDIPF